MGELLCKLRDFAERQLPAAAHTDVELARRARTGLAFAAVFLTQVPIFAALFWLFDKRGAVGFVLFAGAAMLLAPPLLRRSVTLGNRWVIFAMWVTLFGVALTTGGPRGPSLFWMAALPVMASMSLSVREALYWLVAVTLAPLSLIALEHWQGPLPSVQGVWQEPLFYLLAIAMLCSVNFALAFASESMRAAMLRTVQRVNAEMRLVLDNVDQAFITVARDGSMGAMQSSISQRWFGAPQAGDTFYAWLARTDATASAWLRVGLEQVFDGMLPVEVALAQVLSRFAASGRHYQLAFRPIPDRRGELQAVLVIVSDATEHVHAERAEVAQRELMAFFNHVVRDRNGVLQFFREATEIVGQLHAPHASTLRLVHTLKGNAGLFGLTSVMQACHHAESLAQAEERLPTAAELAELRAVWEEAAARVRPLLADDADPINVCEQDLLAVEQAVQAGASGQELVAMLRALRHDRAELVLGRMAEQAEALSRRLGVCDVRCVVQAEALRFDPVRWAGVWSAMVHVVRNAVDHGGQSAEARAAQGKPAALCLRFEARCQPDGSTLVAVSDDGAGIDWERVRERALERGLPSATGEDLHEALFADGLSTRDEVSVLSGRGVGLGALREACAALGARVQLQSERGVGTRVEILARAGATPLRMAG
jgi:HPt (histidine-containing phosphotransfer) domain-containing protein